MSSEAPEDRSPLKPFDQMLEGEFREGMSSYQRSSVSLFVSSISAGIDLSFGVLLLAIAQAFLTGSEESTARFVTAAIYPLGFVFVILGRAELFTEQTTLAIIPVLHGRASIISLCRLWVTVYFGNLLGMGGMVAIHTIVGPALGVVAPADFTSSAEGMTAPAAWAMLISGALAGWLMGLLSWLLTASRDTISQIVLVWLVAAMIGVADLHHSIESPGTVFAAVLSGDRFTIADLGRLLLWATMGNIVGAFVFAGLLKYSEGARGARLQRMEQEVSRRQAQADSATNRPSDETSTDRAS